MTQNLLTQRLKAVKRELTALKTAHRRGFGNLKVYITPLTPQTSSSIGYLKLTLRFNDVPFPFVQVLGTMDSTGDSNIGVFSSGGGAFSPDGLTYKQYVGWYSEPSGPIYIMSTVPPSSITYTWED